MNKTELKNKFEELNIKTDLDLESCIQVFKSYNKEFKDQEYDKIIKKEIELDSNTYYDFCDDFTYSLKDDLEIEEKMDHTLKQELFNMMVLEF